MQQIENLPPVQWSLRHPRIAAWVVLAAGMVILLAIEARDVGLTTGNWIALIVATVLVAGACIWIVSWEDVDDSEPSDATITSTSETVAVKSPETQTETAEPPPDEIPSSEENASDENPAADSDTP